MGHDATSCCILIYLEVNEVKTGQHAISSLTNKGHFLNFLSHQMMNGKEKNALG